VSAAPTAARPTRARARAAALVREHRLAAAVLALAALVRAAVLVAYEPGLMFSDSWSYVRLAYDPGFAIDRPSGYPLLLWLLWLPGRSLLTVTVAQHLAGLATGALVYALLVRLGLRRGWAAAATAVVVLDGYAIALEQFVMAEALFTLALVLGLALAATGGPGTRRLAVAGLLVGGAATLRTLGVFAIPALLAYALWRHRSPRLVAVALAAALAPVLLYSGASAAAGKGFGLTQIEGWALYSRVAPFADCERADVREELRALCQPASERREEPSWYGWSPDSPANRLYGARKGEGNEPLREFGLAVVRAQPLDYAGAVAGDFLRFLRPTREGGEGATAGGFDEPIVLPAPGEGEFRSEFADEVRAQALPGYRREVDPPQAAVRAYRDVVHVPRPLLALLVLAALAELALAALARGRLELPRRREVLLLAGAGLAMLLGAATVEFQLRYLVPSVPLLVAAGALALADLSGALRARRESRPA
jgi:hypothetical protein